MPDVHDALNTPRVHDALNTDNYLLGGVPSHGKGSAGLCPLLHLQSRRLGSGGEPGWRSPSSAIGGIKSLNQDNLFIIK